MSGSQTDVSVEVHREKTCLFTTYVRPRAFSVLLLVRANATLLNHFKNIPFAQKSAHENSKMRGEKEKGICNIRGVGFGGVCCQQTTARTTNPKAVQRKVQLQRRNSAFDNAGGEARQVVAAANTP